MLFGIQAAQDVKLSQIGRELQEPIRIGKVENRLSRNLAHEGMAEKLHACILDHAAPSIHQDTLIIIDPTDIQKQYARKMDYLAKVRDGSKGELGENLGYNGCMAVACESGARQMSPLVLRLWSSEAPDLRGAGLPERKHGSRGGCGFYCQANERSRHLRLRPRWRPNRFLRASAGSKSAFHCAAGGQPELGLAQEYYVAGREVSRQVPHVARLECDIPLAWLREERANPVRRVGGIATGQTRDRFAACCCEGLRREAGNKKLQKSVAGRGGLYHALARRGDNPLYQAVVSTRRHARTELRAAQEHGGVGPVHRPFCGLLDGLWRKAQDSHLTCRGPFAAHQQDAGILLLRSCRRHSEAFHAIRARLAAGPGEASRPNRESPDASPLRLLARIIT